MSLDQTFLANVLKVLQQKECQVEDFETFNEWLENEFEQNGFCFFNPDEFENADGAWETIVDGIIESEDQSAQCEYLQSVIDNPFWV
jgi:hypothetical protein